MRNVPPALAPIFRSDAQLRILGQIFCGPKDSYTLSELAHAADTSAATAGREVDLLRVNGVVNVSSGPGRSKLVSANWALPWAPDLRRILVHTGGLIPTLETLLGGDPRIDAAYIFGSWARRYRGEAGHFPRDIDIVIVSESSQFDLDIAWSDISRELSIELNPIYRPRGYDPNNDTLVAGSPVVKLNLHRDSL